MTQLAEPPAGQGVTTDRNGAAVMVGAKVEYRLSDSVRTSVGEVVEVLASGGMYARNERSGRCDLVYPDGVLIFAAESPCNCSDPYCQV